jgi:peptidoglycan LD-endopeptidase CwlK
MSLNFSKKDVLFFQRILAVSGFYGGPLNGKWNKDVDKAEAKFNERFNKIMAAEGAVDTRSERNIMTMIPKSQVLARRFLKVAAGFKYNCRIISGTRTYAEQNALYAIGRTVKGKKVTNARGGRSNHNFCIAWDVGLFDKTTGRYLTGATAAESKAYRDLAALVKSKAGGLEWGGDWKSFKDQPHYQVATGKSLSQVRALFEKGKPFI